MPIIKPISDLKNKSAEISKLAQDANEPIFLTKNGEGSLVVMSIEYYHQEQKKRELEQKLLESEKSIQLGDLGRESNLVFSDLYKSLKK